MYSKQQASVLIKEFWTTFGRYMTPVLPAENDKVNWMNYKTGEKNVYFKLHADTRSAIITIELTHPDPALRKLYFDRFVVLKNLLTESLGEEWEWLLHSTDETGKTTSKIFKELREVNILEREDWGKLISFFKPRLVALDAFWCSAKYGFESIEMV